MRTETDFAPMWAVPPGRTIFDFMKKQKITSADMATLIAMTEDDFMRLLSGENILTRDIASRLQVALGAPASFWVRREEQYRAQIRQLTFDVDPDNEVYKSWLKSLPLKDMQELGWLNPSKEKHQKLRSCLEFFDVPNFDAWYRTYVDFKAAAAFRTTDSYLEDAPATAAWLRRGELQAEKIACEDWDPVRFAEQLPKIRALTNIASPSEFLPELQKLCASAGVAVVIVKAPKGCRASGATFFSSPRKAVLLLSMRYLSDDQFWFSFFHEAGHLILHWDADLLILETSDSPKFPREEEANRFASEQLIPRAFHMRLPEAAKTLRGIVKLAREVGVSYGIIVGQMQFLGLVRRDRYNRLKNRYNWGQLATKS